eukprot:2724679-Prymnesium_polylepis.2
MHAALRSIGTTAMQQVRSSADREFKRAARFESPQRGHTSVSMVTTPLSSESLRSETCPQWDVDPGQSAEVQARAEVRRNECDERRCEEMNARAKKPWLESQRGYLGAVAPLF